MYLSIEQALGIYDELIDCYHNKNGYGSDTAEIYTYRFLPMNPTYSQSWQKEKSIFEDDILEMEKTAAKSLKEIIDIFIKRNPSKVFVKSYDGIDLASSIETDVPFNTWFKRVLSVKSMTDYNRFSHRIHVKVKPIKKRYKHAK
jgi:hypothetical protein